MPAAMESLTNRRIVLGVTGGIAAYKAVALLRLLTTAGARVRVVMTAGAQKFVTPLTFQALSGAGVFTDLFSLEQEGAIGHVALADWAEAVVVAPASANTLARARGGMADDALAAVLLATRAPVILAPAMNDRMWDHPATQDNLAVLQARGARVVPPGVGWLAEGRHAVGRLAEPEQIAQVMAEVLAGIPPRVLEGVAGSGGLPLAGKRILVSAGPTREAIDPVRYLSNRSSGRMGYCIAEACRELGATVTLVSGPVSGHLSLAPPPGVEVVRVTTALEMAEAVLSRQGEQDALILAAAVSDYRPKEVAAQKIKHRVNPTLTLELVENPDIAQAVGAAKAAMKGGRQRLVVFAAETQDLATHAAAKLLAKNADLVLANDVSAPGQGFDVDTNRLLVIGRDPATGAPLPAYALPGQPGAVASKARLAQEVAALVAKLLG